MMRLIICGEGGLGHEVLDTVLQMQNMGIKEYNEILFLDDDESKSKYMSYTVMPTGRIFDKYDTEDTRFVMAIGEPIHRIGLIERIKSRGYHFETLIHPAAYVGINTSIGEGTVVQRGAIISCDCEIGENCFFQPYSTVGHNCVIGNNTTVSTNAAISGGVEIGNDTYISVGVSVIQGAKIGNNSVVGMSAVVVRDIPNNVVAMGNPARAMENKDDSRVFAAH